MLFKLKTKNLKLKTLLLFLGIVFTFYLLPFTLVKGELNCLDPASITSNTDREICIKQLEDLKNQYLPAQITNKKNLATLQLQLNNLNKRIAAMATQLSIFAKNIRQREESMAYTQKIFEEKTVNNYRFIRTYDPIIPFLATNASTAFRELIFQQKTVENDRQSIESYAKDLDNLRKDKETLEKNKTDIAAVQKQVAERTSFLASEVVKVDAYLATLTAKQQDFLAAKLESLGLSRSAYNMKGGCSSDINPFKSPGFSPAIGFFSFGVPNRVGLNQFGAKGRAETGQNAQTILSAYYNADYTTGYNTGINIHVSGKNEFGQSFNDTWNIEDYLKHLYEMPTDWPVEALKAQAIAARSYALAYTNNGSGSICPSQHCQVVKKELNNGNWQSAVDATRGIVLTGGGNPVKAWFSSTHGGYAYNSGDIGWNTTPWTKRMTDSSGGIGGFSDLFNSAYDKNSPVFYCDWGSRASNNKTAWLRPDELADIVNAVLLVTRDGSAKSHLYQTDKPNPEGVDTWDAGRVKNELSSRGITSLDTVSNISIGADFGTGRTTSVTIDGRTLDGQEFKNYFNLRAPANIQIVGPLYNVEKR